MYTHFKDNTAYTEAIRLLRILTFKDFRRDILGGTHYALRDRDISTDKPMDRRIHTMRLFSTQRVKPKSATLMWTGSSRMMRIFYTQQISALVELSVTRNLLLA